jgi:hypothetical protein
MPHWFDSGLPYPSNQPVAQQIHDSLLATEGIPTVHVTADRAAAGFGVA